MKLANHRSTPCLPLAVLLAATLIGTAGCDLKRFSAGGKGGDGDQNASVAAGDLNETKASPTPEEPPVPISVQDVALDTIQSFLPGTTSLVAEKTAQVVSKGSGQIISLRKEIGDKVKKGETIVTLDTAELLIQKRKAEANIAQLEDTFAKTKALVDERMASSETLDTARFNLQNAKLELESTELSLRYQVVSAPIRGIIIERPVNLGETIANGSTVCKIVDLDSLVARLYVPEKNALSLKEGQSVNLTSDSYPDVTFTGEIVWKAPIVDTSTGTMEVKVGFKTRDERLLPGMFLRANVVLATRENVVVVPKKAVIYDDDDRYAFVVRDGKAERRKLTLGAEDNKRVEVVSGLETGERLVTTGQRGLKDGAKVEVIGDPSPTPAATGTPESSPGPADTPAAPAANATPESKD